MWRPYYENLAVLLTFIIFSNFRYHANNNNYNNNVYWSKSLAFQMTEEITKEGLEKSMTLLQYMCLISIAYFGWW
jgi:hypothetical protein